MRRAYALGQLPPAEVVEEQMQEAEEAREEVIAKPETAAVLEDDLFAGDEQVATIETEAAPEDAEAGPPTESADDEEGEGPKQLTFF